MVHFWPFLSKMTILGPFFDREKIVIFGRIIFVGTAMHNGGGGLRGGRGTRPHERVRRQFRTWPICRAPYGHMLPQPPKVAEFLVTIKQGWDEKKHPAAANVSQTNLWCCWTNPRCGGSLKTSQKLGRCGGRGSALEKTEETWPGNTKEGCGNEQESPVGP